MELNELLTMLYKNKNKTLMSERLSEGQTVHRGNAHKEMEYLWKIWVFNDFELDQGHQLDLL